MFENVGQKIKTLAKVMFACVTILTTVVGVVVGIGAQNGLVMFLSIAFSVILGGIFGYISSLTLYGLGEVVENTKGTQERACTTPATEEHREQVEQIQREQAAAAARIEQAQKEEKTLRQIAEENMRNDTPTDVKKNKYGEVSCPLCGKTLVYENESGIRKCPHCTCLMNIKR